MITFVLHKGNKLKQAQMIKINDEFVNSISQKAKASPRRRMNFNYHKEDAATLQRMLNALEPNTYIQPHKHENPDKVEVFFVLKGRVLLVEFNDDGDIIDHIVLDPKLGNYGGEIPPRVWHSLICLEAGSIAYEVKDGPYDPNIDKHFAAWAPAEGHPDCEKYNRQILSSLKM